MWVTFDETNRVNRTHLQSWIINSHRQVTRYVATCSGLTTCHQIQVTCHHTVITWPTSDPLQYPLLMERNLSCPAVSQIWRCMGWPSTIKLFTLKSSPVGMGKWVHYSHCMKWTLNPCMHSSNLLQLPPETNYPTLLYIMHCLLPFMVCVECWCGGELVSCSDPY